MAGILKDLLDGAPHILNVFVLLFLALSCGLVNWSTTDVRIASTGATGTAEFGIWKACSEMDPDDTPVFSVIGSCRQGHCVKSEKLAIGTTRSDEGLCNRASAVGAFTILAIILTVFSVFFITFRSIMGRTVLWWKGTFYNACACFCSMLAWGIWAAWRNRINDQSTSADDNTRFSEFEYGPGFNLQVLSFLLLLVNTFVCRHNGVLQAQRKLRARNAASPIRERLTTDVYNDTPANEGTTTTGGDLARSATRRRTDEVVVVTSTNNL